MIDLVKVVEVRAIGPRTLHVRFSDGSAGERDTTDILAEDGPMVTPLRDPGFFGRVFVELGTITWPNGFDLDSIALHAEMKASGALGRPAA
ncbi:MAG: DUF2442 domain-containing protein [Alphaproteobacteria bacterium]